MRKYHTLAQALAAAEKLAQTHTQTPLNNLNSRVENNLNPNSNLKLQSQPENLNSLKGKGVPRLELYTDETFKKALSWEVKEWFLQVCIRDYGEYAVKGAINRIYNLPDGYFQQKYGPINQQRGRLLNAEMKKLREGKQVAL